MKASNYRENNDRKYSLNKITKVKFLGNTTDDRAQAKHKAECQRLQKREMAKIVGLPEAQIDLSRHWVPKMDNELRDDEKMHDKHDKHDTDAIATTEHKQQAKKDANWWKPASLSYDRSLGSLERSRRPPESAVDGEFSFARCTEASARRAGKTRVRLVLPGRVEQDHFILLENHRGSHDSPVVESVLISFLQNHLTAKPGLSVFRRTIGVSKAWACHFSGPGITTGVSRNVQVKPRSSEKA